MNKFQTMVKWINSMKPGTVFTRQELLKKVQPGEICYSGYTSDYYRKALELAGYIKRAGVGKYIKRRNISKDLSKNDIMREAYGPNVRKSPIYGRFIDKSISETYRNSHDNTVW